MTHKASIARALTRKTLVLVLLQVLDGCGFPRHWSSLVSEEVATWPLGPAIESRMRPKQPLATHFSSTVYNGRLHERLRHGAEESKSQSLRPGLISTTPMWYGHIVHIWSAPAMAGKLKGASLQFPSRSFDLRESTFMDDRDRRAAMLAVLSSPKKQTRFSIVSVSVHFVFKVSVSSWVPQSGALRSWFRARAAEWEPS